LSGDGEMTKACHGLIVSLTSCPKSLLTHSCTAALEMAAILAEVGPGDEVIIPSYTFVSTANAFVLRGATPVFVDVRPDTLNLDERLLEPAIGPRTRAIVPVHYAGVGCEMDSILQIARGRGLTVIEDAAQAIMASYRGKPLGSFGATAALSFHETKNIISGEGGALLINDPALVERAEIIREKGTNRSRFFRGQVDKYTWVDVGSSFLPSELIAAVLLAQLERARELTDARLAIWDRYHSLLADAEREGLLRRPVVPGHCTHNAHMYYVLMPSLAARTAAIDRMKARGIQAVFHYVPLHSSPGGKRFGKTPAPCLVTDDISDRLLRLPLWIGLSPGDQERVVDALLDRATG
jgi:dTDP-4-amino-4,6-dideoxygalactose transaminase